MPILLKHCSLSIINEQEGDKKYAAIHYAAEKSSEMYQILLRAGADETLKAANGRTAEQIYKNHQEKINDLKQKF